MARSGADHVELAARRARLARAHLLKPGDPGDALAVYYALHHDPRRTRLRLLADDRGRINGLVAVCQTGFDLFCPTVVLRAPDVEQGAALLRAALQPGRPYYVITRPALAQAVRAVMQIETVTVNRLFRFDPARYQPEINVLVQPARAADGFKIHSRGQTAAEAGVNWRSPEFAELYVRTAPWARRRGWGKAVLTACAVNLVQQGVQPLYTAAEEDQVSQHLAQSAAFVDTGVREFTARGVCTAPRGAAP